MITWKGAKNIFNITPIVASMSVSS